MTVRLAAWCTALGIAFAGVNALADALTGADRFTCSATEVTLCSADGECAASQPWEMQIPQFVLVDLAERSLSTTEASGELRTSTIATQVREDGLIILQGIQMGRAFSFVLKEDTGHASIAIALDGLTIGVFGACTPGLPR